MYAMYEEGCYVLLLVVAGLLTVCWGASFCCVVRFMCFGAVLADCFCCHSICYLSLVRPAGERHRDAQAVIMRMLRCYDD